MDIELIRQCADDSLQPAIVERFIEAVGAPPPLAVSVTINGKAVALPKIENAMQAADVVAGYVGRADVRFGLTQYPAGIGQATEHDIDERLFEPCRNIAIGTELFAGIYSSMPEEPGSFDRAVEVYLGSATRKAQRDDNTGNAQPDPPPNSQHDRANKNDGDPFKADIRVVVPPMQGTIDHE